MIRDRETPDQSPWVDADIGGGIGTPDDKPLSWLALVAIGTLAVALTTLLVLCLLAGGEAVCR